MPHFIEGLPPFDGDFPPMSGLTNRGLHPTFQVSVRSPEFGGFLAGDNDLLVSFAVIALQRAGFKVDPDAIWEAEVGRIQFVLDEQETEKLPPPNALDVSADGSGQNGASGESSSAAGDQSEDSPSPTGHPLSDSGSVSDPLTSGT
jgi:hypothetical protein